MGLVTPAFLRLKSSSYDFSPPKLTARSSGPFSANRPEQGPAIVRGEACLELHITTTTFHHLQTLQVPSNSPSSPTTTQRRTTIQLAHRIQAPIRPSSAIALVAFSPVKCLPAVVGVQHHVSTLRFQSTFLLATNSFHALDSLAENEACWIVLNRVF